MRFSTAAVLETAGLHSDEAAAPLTPGRQSCCSAPDLDLALLGALLMNPLCIGVEIGNMQYLNHVRNKELHDTNND